MVLQNSAIHLIEFANWLASLPEKYTIEFLDDCYTINKVNVPIKKQAYFQTSNPWVIENTEKGNSIIVTTKYKYTIVNTGEEVYGVRKLIER